MVLFWFNYNARFFNFFFFFDFANINCHLTQNTFVALTIFKIAILAKLSKNILHPFNSISFAGFHYFKLNSRACIYGFIYNLLESVFSKNRIILFGEFILSILRRFLLHHRQCIHCPLTPNVIYIDHVCVMELANLLAVVVNESLISSLKLMDRSALQYDLCTSVVQCKVKTMYHNV